jgi:hypothetical protein
MCHTNCSLVIAYARPTYPEKNRPNAVISIERIFSFASGLSGCSSDRPQSEQRCNFWQSVQLDPRTVAQNLQGVTTIHRIFHELCE